MTLAELDKLAAAASKRLSKEFGEVVLCTYSGQRYGTDDDPKYRRNPSEWEVAEGERHSQTVITFAFQRGGEEAPWITEATACHHCFATGPTPPQVWKKHVDVRRLRSAAAASAQKERNAVAHFAVPPITCEYIGQKQILPSHAVRYEPDPEKWRVPEGERASQMPVTFLWAIHTEAYRQDRVEVAAHNAAARQSVPFSRDIEIWTNGP